MIKRIFTDDYDFEIIAEGENNYYCFEIIAYDKTNKTKSYITNMNFILSEIIAPLVRLQDYETSVMVNKLKVEKLFNVSIECFNNLKWIKLLTEKLADDKLAGEWSN